jgi:adenine-specific DNA-methyltransferase
MAKKSIEPKKIESIKHKDKRANIPTEELRDFVTEDEIAPKTMLYPRDQSLDPQLVWKGKDAQDQEDLEVPVVPIYIQEKIHPQAIIDALPRIEREQDAPNLFADFNGGPKDFDQKIDFYHHEQNWTNRMILGDSLLVMTSLAEKEGLKGKVQTIYLDPPYGIKFGSNWQVSTRKRDVKDGSATDVTRQPEQVRAFRDTWALGIHSYLAYLRDRLVAARELLTETGSVFVQIGDENVHLVRNVLDEVFGSENFLSQIYFATTGGFPSNELSRIGDYLIWYGKYAENVKYRQLVNPKVNDGTGDEAYKYIQLSDGTRRAMTAEERSGVKPIPERSQIYRLGDLCGQGVSNEDTPFDFEGVTYRPTSNSHWKANYPEGMGKLRAAGRIGLAGRTLSYVRFLDDNLVNPINNAWLDTGHAGFASDKTYIVETNIKVVERCILMTTDPGDLVLDPTCGSGTTAYVAEQWGRRWITCDTSRVALALARTRMMGLNILIIYLRIRRRELRKSPS